MNELRRATGAFSATFNETATASASSNHTWMMTSARRYARGITADFSPYHHQLGSVHLTFAVLSHGCRNA
jgi:hypothetical protein